MAEIAIWFEDSDDLATLKAKGDELLLAGDITGYNIYERAFDVDHGPVVEYAHADPAHEQAFWHALDETCLRFAQQYTVQRISRYLWDPLQTGLWEIGPQVVVERIRGVQYASEPEKSFVFEVSGEQLARLLAFLQRRCFRAGEEPLPGAWETPDIRVFGVPAAKGFAFVFHWREVRGPLARDILSLEWLDVEGVTRRNVLVTTKFYEEILGGVREE
jgi:hypothetical protein